MKVRALQIGEHPQGTWRQPGEVFDFAGTKKELGSWMELATAKDKADKKDAEDDAKAAEVKAKEDAERAEAEKKANEEAEAAKKAAEGEGDGDEGDKTPKHHTVHKGFGKWDVFAPDGKVVEGGDNLKKEEAAKLVDKLNGEPASEE